MTGQVAPLVGFFPERARTETDFSGWRTAMSFRGILPEAAVTREKGSYFDCSHLSKILVAGPGAAGLLEKRFAGAPGRLSPGEGRYTFACNGRGGIVEDLIFYRLAAPRDFFPDAGAGDFLLMGNTANRDKLLGLLAPGPGEKALLRDQTLEYGLLAVQGPGAADVLAACGAGAALAALRRNGGALFLFGGAPAYVTRSGYTGEDGFEIILSRGAGFAPGRFLVEVAAGAGLFPAGLGARDVLRIEAGLPLYGQELDEETNPYEAGYGWAVDLRTRGGRPRSFPGAPALREAAARPPGRRLVLLKTAGRSIPRPGQEIRSGGIPAGHVTSGTYSPFFSAGIALGYIVAGAKSGLEILVRDRPVRAEIIPGAARGRSAPGT